MWEYNSDYKKWSMDRDQLVQNDYDYLKQELSSVRFYSKCLSGATYLPMNDTNNIYDILGEYEPRNWYVGLLGSQYSNTLIPPKNAIEITPNSSYDYYQKYLPEYGLTLKNLFTPDRLIKDSINNYIYVDIATNSKINDITQPVEERIIDGVRVKIGHRILIKDQKSRETLPISINPDNYFEGSYEIIHNYGTTIEYEFYNSDNGIYRYDSDFILRKEDDLDDYSNCIRFSVIVKLGSNREKQYHLSRLNNGYYPTSSLNQPMEFIEKHNWLLRNRVDYNNLFEINYYDVIKHGTQSYVYENITYTIPERIISVGEFGVILNNQSGVSNIINNKYKYNLRGISQTSKYYWICGDKGLLLRVRKHDFDIKKLNVDCECDRKIVVNNLNSIDFFDDLRGVVVGDLNTLLITEDGGITWKRIRIEQFNSYYFNKVIYSNYSSIFIGGDSGVFLELRKDASGWIAYKRRISKFIGDEEYLLVDNINNLHYTNMNNWGVTHSYGTQSIGVNKEMLFIVTDDSKVIIHDINDSIPRFDFIYLDFIQSGSENKFGDIKNISQGGTSSNFYFTGIDENNGNSGLFSFDLNNFLVIGDGTVESNISTSTYSVTHESIDYPNETFDYDNELLICGNNSLLKKSPYGTTFSFTELDINFESRLKSKMLFLDYDMGSKLNFFTDDGDYRKPNSVTFSTLSMPSELSFSPLVIAAATPSFMTQSETNWYTYWTDSSKTFEYNKKNEDSSVVLMSSTFSATSQITSLTIGSVSITTNLSDILNLAPDIQSGNRFNVATASSPTTPYDLYLYDYLMILKVSPFFPASIGDVIHLDSGILKDNFVINKITLLGTDKYIYMFSEFNQNIINELSKQSTITFTNLNKYSSFSGITELEQRFNLHPISNGYELIYDSASNEIKIDSKFNNLTSYYNLATSVDFGVTKEMVYTDGFLKFGYTPTYNILDYLESINNINDINPPFYADKEYYAMPDYRGIPLNTISLPYIIDDNKIHIDKDYPNKLIFGGNLKLEWESLFINTFVDVKLDSVGTDRLLIMKKYKSDYGYIIEFHKKLKGIQTSPITIDIISRRKLHQISSDLQELNNIQRDKLRVRENNAGSTSSLSEFVSYERELNFKIPTDSYAKILLSDVDTIQQLTTIFYIDYKNELSMNMTRLEREYKIPILTTSDFMVGSQSKLFIYCEEKHDLETDDGVVLEFNGMTGSSQELNQQYFGYHPVTVVNQYNFYVDVPYGTIPLVGNDTGFVRYVQKDPFLNYSPVDIIDVGVDKKGKTSVELSVDNLELYEDKYRLIDVDYKKYRFRLIDGLTIEQLSIEYPWILEAEISGAVLGLKDNNIAWYKGIWECGRWFEGSWISGTWMSGDWYGGNWYSKTIKDNYINIEVDDKSSDINQSTWFGGRWYDGNWENGLWVDGRWYGGTWNNGTWNKGIWNDGTWNNGKFGGGVWILGTWNNGIFNTDNEPAYWLDGNWYGGDFENGMWYNGLFESKNSESRFGTKSYNSRTSTWHGGSWVSGSFHSRLNTKPNGEYDVSDTHKYSIWKTGKWFNGDWYGGVAYNMDFKSGVWNGGILEDIQVIGFGNDGSVSESYFILNGIFKFNIGDEINIINNNINTTYSNDFGSNQNPGKYKILNTKEDDINKWTKIYVNSEITYNVNAPVNLGLRLVSRFQFCNWKSGIWTNGLYDSGLWEGGIWYNGVFGDATWM